MTNRQTSKLDFNRFYDKQESDSKDQPLNFREKNSMINDNILPNEPKRIVIKRFSDIGRQPIMNLDKITEDELNNYNNSAK